MPGLTIEEKKRRAEKPPEIEQGPPRKPRNAKKHRKFDELFQTLLVFKSTNSHCNVPLRYTADRALGQWVTLTRNTQGGKITQEQKERLTDIGFDWESRAEKDERRWREMFQKLKVYRREHGDCNVPQFWKQNPSLASWVHSQRCKEAKDKLPPHHKQKLESIKFRWRQRTSSVRNSSAEDEKWFDKYKKLVSFHKRLGHCLVPENFQDKSLGNWVGKQREYFKGESLKKERQELLNGLGFVWKVDCADPNASRTLQAEWEDMFQHLLEFKSKHGHVQVNRRYSKWGLGNWVSVQRTNGRKGVLDPRRARRLQQIGLEWGQDWDSRWEEGFALLQKFKARHGHCLVPRNPQKGASLSQKKLRNWVDNQRAFSKKGVLLPDRKKALDDIEFVWEGEYMHSASTRIQSREPGPQSVTTGYNSDEHEEYEFEG